MNNETKEKLARSLTAETTELLPYLPYLLRDFWSLGSDPRIIACLAEKHGPYSKILDLGCGKGAVSVELASRLKIPVKGIDIIPEFIRFATQKAKEHGVEDLCRFVTEDINLSVEKERDYDCVVFASVGNVLGNTAETLYRLKQTIKPGGYLIIDDAYLPEGQDIKYEYDYLTKSQWLTLFKDLGLKIAEAFQHTETNLNEEKEMAYITARAEELMEKYPDKKTLFEGYIRSQQNEYDDLNESLVCVIWVLRLEE